ncbi:hypothetical protein FOZ60_007695 [Perkinsus olseni]|uniref:protein-serine/threonine phosphatase n=1 Tax=Perkinsus olseni TaxID=32597 RepID=A0A7J6NLL4_PEROL|nr:hypothetical protein FOZ60_007695 [Perkinsus olseni]
MLIGSPAGETFGSDESSKDVTLYIEGVELAPKHATVKYHHQTSQYFLQDASYQYNGSGTWVKLRWDRSVELMAGQEISVGGSIISISPGPGKDLLTEWLSIYGLNRLGASISNLHPVLKELRSCHDFSAVYECRTELMELQCHRPRGRVLLKRYSNPQEPPYKTSGYGKFVRRGSLRVVSHPGTRQGGDSTGEEPPSEEKAIRWTKRECLHVAFVHGRYYAHLGELSIDSGQSVWLRLSRDHPHWLQLMDEFRIGKLEFTACRFQVGVCHQQGYRPTMEDEEISLHDLAVSNKRQCSWFAVYDGHGGLECVNFLRKYLHLNFVAQLYQRGGSDDSQDVYGEVLECLKQAHHSTDEAFIQTATEKEWPSATGCVSVTVLIMGRAIICANTGDARAVLSRNGR